MINESIYSIQLHQEQPISVRHEIQIYLTGCTHNYLINDYMLLYKQPISRNELSVNRPIISAIPTPVYIFTHTFSFVRTTIQDLVAPGRI